MFSAFIIKVKGSHATITEVVSALSPLRDKIPIVASLHVFVHHRKGKLPFGFPMQVLSNHDFPNIVSILCSPLYLRTQISYRLHSSQWDNHT